MDAEVDDPTKPAQRIDSPRACAIPFGWNKEASLWACRTKEEKDLEKVGNLDYYADEDEACCFVTLQHCMPSFDYYLSAVGRIIKSSKLPCPAF